MSSEHNITESTPEGGAGALGGLWGIYYRRGYEDGARQVVRDLLGALVTISEEFLRSAGNGPSSDEPRKLVYAFERHLELQIEAIASQVGFVEGGLGI